MPFFELEYRVDPLLSFEYLFRDLGIEFDKKVEGEEVILKAKERPLIVRISTSSEDPGILRKIFKEIKKFRIRVESEDENLLEVLRGKIRLYMLRGGG